MKTTTYVWSRTGIVKLETKKAQKASEWKQGFLVVKAPVKRAHKVVPLRWFTDGKSTN